MMKINVGQRGPGVVKVGGQLQDYVSLVDGISISNHTTKHRSAVSVFCRFQNFASACNAGGSSSLHTRMNATARLMQQLRCTASCQRTSKPASVCCSTCQTHSARKHWHGKHSAQHSSCTRATAAAPALSLRDPTSHAPLSTQPNAPSSCTSRTYRQARWPVDGTRSPRSRT